MKTATNTGQSETTETERCALCGDKLYPANSRGFLDGDRDFPCHIKCVQDNAELVASQG